MSLDYVVDHRLDAFKHVSDMLKGVETMVALYRQRATCAEDYFERERILDQVITILLDQNGTGRT